MIKIPANISSKFTNLGKITETYLTDRHRLPTDEELMTEMGISERELRNVKNFMLNKQYSLSDTVSDENGMTIEDTIMNYDKELYVGESLTTDLTLLINSLPDRERYIVKHYWGIGTPCKKMEEIADDLGLCRERIRQLVDESVKRLKSAHNLDILKQYL